MKALVATLILAPALSMGASLGAAAQQPILPANQDQPTQTQPATQPTPSSLITVLNESAPPPAPSAQASSLATVALQGVSLSGSLSVENGLGIIGNNGSITAGEQTARVSLTRGGSLNVCATTKIHLSTDNTTQGGALTIAIDRGALEAHYLPGEYSDVVLTPDLRILISGPGQANLSLRVNNQGDTCIDNHGDRAPYVLASSLFEGGAYRVQPNQRVLFEHGSLQQVVDNENEPCGCPPPAPTPTPTNIVNVGAPGGTLRSSSSPTPPPPTNSAAAQNPFPLAQSEGLKPPAPPTTMPVVPTGEAHAQITAPLVYNGETSSNVGMPASSVSAPTPTAAATAQPTPPSKSACNDPLYPGVVCDSDTAVNQATPKPENPPATSPTPAPKPKKSSGFAHFLRKIFGG